MTESKVLMSSDKPVRGNDPAVGHAVPWVVVSWAALGFAVVGGLDVALVLFPTSFGVAEWEFGTVTAMLNGLPLPALSLALLVAAGLARGARAQVRLGALGLLVLALLIMVGAVFYALTAPLALRAITEGVARVGVIKSVIKTTTQLVVYPVCFSWLAFTSWRHTRTREET